MRTCLLVALLCAASNFLPCQTVSNGVETNFACVERLQIPTYPSLAKFAVVDGTVEVSVSLSATATVQEIKLRPNLLTQSVEAALRNATFNSDCGGKTVRLKFIFEFAGQPSVVPKQFVTFEAPNKFRITSEPQHAIVN
jgi:hypothetical protein